jgi:hypothetical protein
MGDESRALLQLLLVRGKDYGQIADLLGIDSGEVRLRTARAIGELEGIDADLAPPVTDYLVGRADPIARAEAVRALSEDAALADGFGNARDQLTLLFPSAEIPAPPGAIASSGRRPGVSGKRLGGPGSEGTGSDSSRGQSDRSRPSAISSIQGKTGAVLAALVAAVGLAGIVAVVILLGGGGADQEVADNPPPPTAAVLRPPSGGDARGEVEFGFAGERFAANVALRGLEPNGQDDGYALWLEGPAGSFPFDSARVGQEGSIAGRSEISQAIICFIAADLFTEVKVSRVTDSELTGALRAAVDRNVQEAEFPNFVGQTVLSGPISMPLESRQRIIEVCGGRNQAGGGDSPGS